MESNGLKVITKSFIAILIRLCTKRKKKTGRKREFYPAIWPSRGGSFFRMVWQIACQVHLLEKQQPPSSPLPCKALFTMTMKDKTKLVARELVAHSSDTYPTLITKRDCFSKDQNQQPAVGWLKRDTVVPTIFVETQRGRETRGWERQNRFLATEGPLKCK